MTKEYSQPICADIAQLLAQHGVEDVILSSGTRNAPLTVAVARHPQLNYRIVLDERCAAFTALGMAAQSGRRVALVCTSGSAMLNYAPAVAEAFYREVPLIVITADRPLEWIDQDDSQTIRQPGALDNIVKYSCDIPVDDERRDTRWLANRLVNDALAAAVAGRPGPVHINVHINRPGDALQLENSPGARMINAVYPSNTLPVAEVRQLAALLAPPQRVLVICGFMAPNQKLNRALSRMAALPNVAVMCEAQANLHLSEAIYNIDGTLCRLSRQQRQDLAPDVVITVGGSLVSRFVKEWMRGAENIEHWHIGTRGQAVDCFRALSLRIEIPASSFLPQLAAAMQPFAGANSSYAALWRQVKEAAVTEHAKRCSNVPWSDLSAMNAIVDLLPRQANLHVSNGTAVRYLQLCNYTHLHRIECNRGVSGIDGCTSTAIGAAAAYSGPTYLVTGDMSAQYDMGALAIGWTPASFRIIVLNNGGGGIFRFIKDTSQLPELEECFVADVRLPLRQLADGFGYGYLEARNMKQLTAAMAKLYADTPTPMILNVITDGELSATVLRNYFKKDN